jgi:hypothetical protein
MKVRACLIALLCLATPALARPHHGAWSEAGRPSYARPDYGAAGPAPIYLAPNAYVEYAAPGAHFYTYRNGVRVWYGSAPAFAPVLTTGATLLPQGPPVKAPASPGPRLYRDARGVRAWYGQ